MISRIDEVVKIRYCTVREYLKISYALYLVLTQYLSDGNITILAWYEMVVYHDNKLRDKAELVTRKFSRRLDIFHENYMV